MVLGAPAASQAQQRADKPCLELPGQDRWMAGATGTCSVPNPTWTPICLLLQAGVRWKPALAARQHGGQSPCQAVPPEWVSTPHASQASTAWGLSPLPKGMIYKITHTHTHTRIYIYLCSSRVWKRVSFPVERRASAFPYLSQPKSSHSKLRELAEESTSLNGFPLCRGREG